MLKRIVCMCVITLMLISAAPTLAVGEQVSEVVTLDAMLADEVGWTNREELRFKNGTVSQKHEKKSSFTNKNFTFLNEIVSFTMESNYGEDGKNWPGFMLRSSLPDTTSWGGNNSYLFVLSKGQIELQRWIDKGSVYLAVIENPIPENEPVSIKCGAVNVEKGVQIVLFMNDELILSVLDETPGVLGNQKGYFSFFSQGDLILSGAGENGTKVPSVASGFAISGTGNLGAAITAEYSFLDVSGAEETNTKIEWYRAERDFGGESLSAKVLVSKEGLLTKIEGAESMSYVPVPEDVGYYIVAAISPASRNGVTSAYHSNAVYIDPVRVTLDNNISMIAGEQMAYSFGDCRQIDAKDPYIVPEYKHGMAFMPLRFVVEALGGNIGWDAEQSRVEFTVNGNTCIVHNDSDVITVNGSERTLPAAVYMLYDRTMLPVDGFSEISGKAVYASQNGVVLIGDYENTLDFDTDEALYQTIFKTIRRASYAE